MSAMYNDQINTSKSELLFVRCLDYNHTGYRIYPVKFAAVKERALVDIV